MELTDLCQVKDILATIVALEAKLREATSLSLNQAFVMCCLAKGDQSPTELAGNLRIPAPSLSRILRTLVAKNLILRDHDGPDARQIRLSLTESGRELAATLRTCETNIFPAVVVEPPQSSLRD